MLLTSVPVSLLHGDSQDRHSQAGPANGPGESAAPEESAQAALVFGKGSHSPGAQKGAEQPGHAPLPPGSATWPLTFSRRLSWFTGGYVLSTSSSTLRGGGVREQVRGRRQPSQSPGVPSTGHGECHAPALHSHRANWASHFLSASPSSLGGERRAPPLGRKEAAQAWGPPERPPEGQPPHLGLTSAAMSARSSSWAASSAVSALPWAFTAPRSFLRQALAAFTSPLQGPSTCRSDSDQ